MVNIFKSNDVRDRMANDVARQLGIETREGYGWSIEECYQILSYFPLDYLKYEHQYCFPEGVLHSNVTAEWGKAVDDIFVEKSLSLSGQRS